ncbi:MAG: DUF4129 domain-containing protein [Chloroflexi bacterium]|nr:DUF4129 domain-containing protein [Chloroflexota bacterium]
MRNLRYIYINRSDLASYQEGIVCNRLRIFIGIVMVFLVLIYLLMPQKVAAGNYNIPMYSAGNPVHQSWIGSEIIIYTTTSLTLNTPTQINKDEPFQIQGSLTEKNGTGIPMQSVNIVLNDLPLTSVITDDAGNFNLEHTFTEAGYFKVEAIFEKTLYLVGSSTNISLQVSIPTIISLEINKNATSSKSFIISGSLSEKSSGISIQGQEVALLINGTSKGNLVSNSNGLFQTEYLLKDDKLHNVEVRFNGNSFFLPSNFLIDLDAKSRFQWLYLTLGLTMVAAGTGSFFLIKRLRKHWKVIHLKKSLNPVVTTIPKTHKTSSLVEEYVASYNIELPQIKSPFPDVWGLGEDLEIVSLLNQNQARKPVELSTGDGIPVQLKADDTGLIKLSHTFNKEGNYDISLRLIEDYKLEASREIRITNYRQEIVDIFNKMIEWFRNQGIEIPSNATPREIQHRVTQKGTGISEDALDMIVSCFEEADYSLHPISRKQYKTMFLARKKVMEHGEN